MRHNKKFNHLSRTADHRNAMLANMAISLIMHKRITTTLAKAKALKKYVEPLITRSKDDSTNSRRVVFSYLQNKYALKELFGPVAEKVGDRPGGYTRIIKLGFRQGDAAQICFIELVDFDENMAKTPKTASKKTRRSRKSSAKVEENAAPTAEVAEEAAAEAPVAEEGKMENQDVSKDNEYLSKILERYDFIESIIITDFDGSLMISSFQNSESKSEEDKKNLRSVLSYYFSVSLDQISKTVKWKTNSVTSFYDKHVIYQRKLNDVALCHMICKEDDYCHIIVQNIADNIREKFEPIEKKLSEIKKENDKEND